MYELEIPKEPQDLQVELNIGKTGNFSLQMKVCDCAATCPVQANALHNIQEDAAPAWNADNA